MPLPSISVIIPSYNQGQFIEQTICSILSQEYPGLELIVIDGGSTDNTVDIIKKYEPHIAYWVSEKDKGQTDAILKGFTVATGEVINWLCSDDWLEPGSLHAIGKAFSKHPDWEIVHGQVKVTRADGTPFYHNKVGTIDLKRLLCHWLGDFSPPQPAIFYKRALYESVRGLNPALHYAMDYDLWLQFIRKASFHYIPVLVAYQRYHDSSKTVSGNGFEKFFPELLECRKRFFRETSLVNVLRYAHFLGSYKTRRLASRCWQPLKKQLVAYKIFPAVK